VRQGASWTATYHRQLTVAAAASPIRGSVGALGVLAAERSWLLLAQTTSARSSLRPVSSGRASAPWSPRPAAPRRRSPLSSMRCPLIRSRGPGSGCPAVRCPVTWGRRPEGPALGRLLSTRAVSSRLLSTRAVSSCMVSSRLVSAPCPSGRVRLLPCSGGSVGDSGRAGRATVTTGTGGGPGGCRVVDGSIDGREAGTRATLARSRWSLGGRSGPGPPGWVWAAAAALPTQRPGRPGRRGERSSRAAARWAREQAAARGWRHRTRGWRPRAGGDHGGWSSPSLTPGWAAPEGSLEVPAGMGVRPQRGPSRQRARPARCRQRCDLRRWVVGLPGLEPGTSSLSGIEG
jgi:hypothetical protein